MAGLPPSHTISFVAGDTLKFKFQITDRDLDDPEAPPVPRDLTGCTVLAQVRLTATTTEVLATWDVINEPLGSDGVVELKIEETETQNWSVPKTMVSDVQITDTNDDVETVLTLVINAAQDVTRPEVP